MHDAQDVQPLLVVRRLQMPDVAADQYAYIDPMAEEADPHETPPSVKRWRLNVNYCCWMGASVVCCYC